MTNTGFTEYFLGANTPAGFHSYFEASCPVSEGWNVYIIKGGPGTGKSTLMRRICREAEKRGLLHERIYCSSDPHSLDGVIITELHAAIYDGTAPHVMEPKFPGAFENIINLGEAWSTAMLRSTREDIISCSAQCSQYHAQATRFLRCAEVFRQNTMLPAADAADKQRIARTAEHLADKYFGGNVGAEGHESTRLLSAVTPLGIHLFTETLTTLCSTIVPIRDSFYAPSALLMKALHAELLSRGCEIITCACSQSPDRIEHIIIPSIGTAFSVSSDIHPAEFANERAVHTKRFLPSDFIAVNKQKVAVNKRNITAFTELAAAEMRHAKAVHDRLEEYYRQAMNFDAVDEIAEKACKIIFS